jgi:transcription-repair coupling factor (superfamily II helicase)
VLNLIDIALLRANARKAGITDIKQKATDVLFTLANLNFEAVTALCAEKDYKDRISLVASAKVPTLRLRLASGVDSLKQSKIFIERYLKLLEQ